MKGFSKMKINANGSINYLPGENLANAILDTQILSGSRCPVGIPPQRISEALEIMKEALEDDEWGILRKGFGLNCERMSQKDIATNMGLTPNTVSDIMWAGVKKLQQAKYKNRLRALIPTNAYLYQAMETRKTIAKAEREIAGYKDGIREREQCIEQLKAQLQNAEERSEALRKQLTEARQQTSQSTGRVMQLMSEVEALRKENENLQASQQQMAMTFQTLQRVFGSVGATAATLIEEQAEEQAAKAATSTAVDEVFFGEILRLLQRAGINDLATLCGCTERSLTSLKIPQRFVDVIKRKLGEIGLSLREAA